MKKLVVITIIMLVAVSSFGRTYNDTITGSFANNDTLKFADLNDCNGKKVTITLAIKNTDGVDADFYIVGKDSRVSIDYKVEHWEAIVATGLPFTIDTTDVTISSTGLAYRTRGSNYVYTKTYTIDVFQFEIPGVYFDLNTTTAGEYTIYFKVEDDL